MQDKLREQIAPTPENGDKIETGKDGKTSYGKFKSPEELLAGYGALESEFTRRSQRLKELESAAARKEAEDVWTKRVDELTAKFPVAKDLTEEIGDYIADNKDVLNEENCLEKALLFVLAKGYIGKDKLTAKPPAASEVTHSVPEGGMTDGPIDRGREDAPITAPSGGEIPVAFPKRPKTISEAGELARQIFKNKI